MLKVHLLPLNVDGAADINTNDIFISYRLLSDSSRFVNCLIHELSHLLVKSTCHNKDWMGVNKRLGGQNTLFTEEKGEDLSLAFNIGNISGITNILTDYHLLQAYRKFSKKVLGTEGHWEVINEGNSNVEGDALSAKDQLIRLYPTPKGAFPVVVLYTPVVTHFRSPQARMVCYDMMLAEAKIVLGSARRKITGIPTPDGGSLNLDGSDLVQEGEKMKEEIIQKALHLGEPDSFWLY
jgi:hypothetical protein